MKQQVVLRPSERAVKTLQFNIVKSKESGVKSLLTKLTLFKRSIEARRLGRTIHD